MEGFSHKKGGDFDAYHAAHPARPKFASECCSCSMNRDDPDGYGYGYGGGSVSNSSEGGGDGNWDGNGNGKELSCTASQSNASNGREFMVGTMVWTLFDYYGESHGWPRVSSSYGQIDLAGFFKTNGYWYRTFWLSAVPESDASRPVGFGAAHSCHTYGVSTKGVTVLTEAPTVKLYVNGTVTQTARTSPLLATSLPGPGSIAGTTNVTVVCVGEDGGITASQRIDSILTAGVATAIVLSLDAPSVKTGTGTSLLLDGHDVAMLRATIVDASGTSVTSTANVSFSIKGGPGRVIATHNGDQACHEPNDATWHSAYVGLVRCFVQVTEHRVGSIDARRQLASIDREVAHTTVPTADFPKVAESITVVASSPGLTSAEIEIPVSAEDQHGVLQTATRSFDTEQSWD